MKAHFAGHRGARKYGRYLKGTWIGGDAEKGRPHSRWATFKHQIALRLVVTATYARTFASVFVRAALISNKPPARALAPPAAVGWRLAPLPNAPAATSAAPTEAADDDSDDDDDDDWEGLHAARMAQLMSSRQGSLSSGLPSSSSSQGRGFGKGMGGGARGKGKGTVHGIGKVQRPQRAATASARASAAAADASLSASTRAASTRDASTRRRESRAAARGH